MQVSGAKTLILCTAQLQEAPFYLDRHSYMYVVCTRARYDANGLQQQQQRCKRKKTVARSLCGATVANPLLNERTIESCFDLHLAL